MNLRKDQYFVQDEAWYEKKQKSGSQIFLRMQWGRIWCYWKWACGFNTPTIIRFPFEKLAREHKNIQMIRLNLDDAAMPEDFDVRGIGIEGDLACVIPQL